MLFTGTWHIGMPDSLKFESNAFFFFATYLSNGILFNFNSIPGLFFTTLSQMIQAGVPPGSLFHSFSLLPAKFHKGPYSYS